MNYGISRVYRDEKQPKPLPQKKSRKSYSFIEKASVLLKYLEEIQHDPELSISVFAQENKISKSMLHRWIEAKELILKKAYEGCILKKYRPIPKKNPKHAKTHALFRIQNSSSKEKGAIKSHFYGY